MPFLSTIFPHNPVPGRSVSGLKCQKLSGRHGLRCRAVRMPVLHRKESGCLLSPRQAQFCPYTGCSSGFLPRFVQSGIQPNPEKNAVCQASTGLSVLQHWSEDVQDNVRLQIKFPVRSHLRQTALADLGNILCALAMHAWYRVNVRIKRYRVHDAVRQEWMRLHLAGLWNRTDRCRLVLPDC